MSGAIDPREGRGGPPGRNRRFDPKAWHAAYDMPEGQIFAETVETAARLQSRNAHAGEIWVDVGCGTGRLSRRIASSGCRVVAVDEDRAMLSFARNLDRTALPAGAGAIHYVKADGLRLPLPERSVDGIAAVSLLGLIDHPERLLAETARVLRNDGVAIISFSNRWSLLRGLQKLLPPVHGRRRSSLGVILPARTWSAASAERAFRRAGFRVEDIYPYGFFIYPWIGKSGYAGHPEKPGMPCRNRAARFVGRNFMVVARKSAGRSRPK